MREFRFVFSHSLISSQFYTHESSYGFCWVAWLFRCVNFEVKIYATKSNYDLRFTTKVYIHYFACAVGRQLFQIFVLLLPFLSDSAQFAFKKEQYPVTAHVPNFDFLTGCREFKRCEESKDRFRPYDFCLRLSCTTS